MAETVDSISCGALIIGGSAGSLDVLLEIFPALRNDISFPIVLVVHRKASNQSLLTDLLKSRTTLTVSEAEEKEFLNAGKVFIAPADYHMLIEEDQSISLDYSEKVNYSRPSIDVTFQSAAEVFKEKLVCILLSGSNADGVEGLKSVNNYSGRVVIQNPRTAIMPYMPQQAVLNVEPHIILDSYDMANYINKLNG
ncbi:MULTISPECIES: chemotaxis protein CheB [unclassified Pedobacter]|uniref:chemotaxis protein CheB n=1 Tax=unclassified Pedobacter TaxID=2628915 RepID=UPI0014241523|nr:MULTISPECIES: chemotaxis protein CheB [unclassified Pedobacter]NII84468.1 two-component system chemotaxis response regulator CheB [Pedobacter sp. SG908]NMN38617.1 two-component system chemotaxis response regulator CheB [Pedobacter sp. SG918]